MPQDILLLRIIPEKAPSPESQDKLLTHDEATQSLIQTAQHLLWDHSQKQQAPMSITI